jgi:hypothetical protein
VEVSNDDSDSDSALSSPLLVDREEPLRREDVSRSSRVGSVGSVET